MCTQTQKHHSWKRPPISFSPIIIFLGKKKKNQTNAYIYFIYIYSSLNILFHFINIFTAISYIVHNNILHDKEQK